MLLDFSGISLDDESGNRFGDVDTMGRLTCRASDLGNSFAEADDWGGRVGELAGAGCVSST